MAGIGSSIGQSSTVVVNVNTTPVVYNLTLTLANTEYIFTLPANCKGFLFRNRNHFETKFSFTALTSGTVYATLEPRAVFTNSDYYTSQSVYFQSPSAGGTLEIITYA